jgi:hypothetical protein
MGLAGIYTLSEGIADTLKSGLRSTSGRWEWTGFESELRREELS